MAFSTIMLPPCTKKSRPNIEQRAFVALSFYQFRPTFIAYGVRIYPCTPFAEST
jgi:hypothetical protein